MVFYHNRLKLTWSQQKRRDSDLCSMEGNEHAKNVCSSLCGVHLSLFRVRICGSV